MRVKTWTCRRGEVFNTSASSQVPLPTEITSGSKGSRPFRNLWLLRWQHRDTRSLQSVSMNLFQWDTRRVYRMFVRSQEQISFLPPSLHPILNLGVHKLWSKDTILNHGGHQKKEERNVEGDHIKLHGGFFSLSLRIKKQFST